MCWAYISICYNKGYTTCLCCASVRPEGRTADLSRADFFFFGFFTSVLASLAFKNDAGKTDAHLIPQPPGSCFLLLFVHISQIQNCTLLNLPRTSSQKSSFEMMVTFIKLADLQTSICRVEPEWYKSAQKPLK